MVFSKRNCIDSLGEQPANTLTLEIFPHGTSTYSIYDDDGKSKDYENGEYAVPKVTANDNDRQFDVESRLRRVNMRCRSVPIS